MKKPAKQSAAKTIPPHANEVPRVKRSDTLTEREADVLKMFARGFTYQEIGDKLGISTKTISSYLQRVREKKRVKSRAGLVAAAIELKLLPAKGK